MKSNAKHIAKIYRINENDVRIITDFVNVYKDDLTTLKIIDKIRKVFSYDITLTHMLVIGHVIGETSANSNEEKIINKFLCQKQN
jgi:hypothetical protein